ncbi:hypothetical protein [Halobacteriovorax sp. ZH2_bin.1]|uniref:hypothetical protein n=1 Tax=unclassified Halobacteriovorax TaxID=2639665 RepID=UPI00371A6338
MNYNNVKKIILVSIFLTSVYADNVILPFGRGIQVPTREKIDLIDTKIGIETQQVCGYTDYTTMAIHLPKKIVSKQYWKGVGKRAVKAAKNTVYNIGGALPDIIMMNASPSFYAVMSQAQTMASYQAFINKEDCKLLEDVVNKTGLDKMPIAECMSKRRPGETIAEVQTRCQQNPDSDLSSDPSKEERIANVQRVAGRTDEDYEKFLEKVFDGEETKVNKNTYFKYNNGRAFSRTNKAIEWSKDLAHGLSFKSSLLISGKGEVAKDSISSRVITEREKTEEDIVSVLNEASRLLSKGSSESDIRDHLYQKYYSRGASRGDIGQSFIYPSDDGQGVTPLIEPELLITIAKMNKGSDDAFFKKEGTKQNEIVRRMATLKGYVDAEQNLLKIQAIAQKNCLIKQDLQGAQDQINCKNLIKVVELNRERIESEKRLSETLYEEKRRLANIALMGGSTNRANSTFIDSYMKGSKASESSNVPSLE